MAPPVGIKAKVGEWVNIDDMARVMDQAAVRLPHGMADNNNNRDMVIYSNARKILSEELRGKATDLLSPVCPYNVRQACVASFNAKVEHKDGDYIRFKNLWDATTVGAAFSLAARAIRVVFRIAFIWLSTLVALYQQSTYAEHMEDGKKYNIVFEDWKRIGYEIVDLFTSILTPFIGIINFFAPTAISTDWLRDYYIDRIDQVRARNETFEVARTAYFAQENARHLARNAAPADGAPARD